MASSCGEAVSTQSGHRREIELYLIHPVQIPFDAIPSISLYPIRLVHERLGFFEESYNLRRGALIIWTAHVLAGPFCDPNIQVKFVMEIGDKFFERSGVRVIPILEFREK